MRLRGSSTRVGQVLPGVLSALRLDESLRAQSVVQRFPEIAGERLSRHVRAVAVEEGVLLLEAEAPVWAAEIRHLERRLVRQIHETCGAEPVRAIRCTLRSGAWRE